MLKQLVIFLTLLVGVVVSQNSTPLIHGRVAGGVNAVVNQFPYMASLRSNNVHFCGASILNNRWVLSGAQCVIGRALGGLQVVVGSISRTAGIVNSVSRVVIHPGYNANTLANDTAVIQTAGNLTFTAAVQAIPLGSTFFTTANLVLTGFGFLGVNGTLATTLQYANLMSLTNADCRARFGVADAARVFDSNICTFTRVGQGACYYDSGSPLVNAGQLVGMVSWGINCAAGWPDVHVRISSQRNWILAAIQ